MATMIEELTKLGKEIGTAKTQVSQLKGRESEVLDRLKKDFGCNTVDEAQVLLNQMDSDINIMEVTIQQQFKELKEAFSW